ncbi:MAG: endonuclease/exonuclease/phosphatase family protein [Anaerolineae bacterium]|nr:endonuclease/exonuclease/phosphatase family protein [Anaerolineae bacterium]
MQILAGVLWQSFRAFTGAYGLSLAGLLFLNLILREDQALWLAFFNSFAHLMLLPALVLFPLVTLLRQWLLSALLLPAILFFTLTYGGQFLPNRSAEVPQDAQTMRLMTFNVLAGNRTPEAVIAQIALADADIVALQEVSQAHAALLRTEFADEYAFMGLHPQEYNGTQGQGILSRYRLIEDRYFQYDFVPHPLGHQRAVLERPDGSRMVVYNVHPSHPGMNGSYFDPSMRSRELAQIRAEAAAETLPVIIMGDFNMPELSDDHAALSELYTDTYRTAGWGMGWTFRYPITLPPLLRLDYIFLGDAFTPLHAEVVYPFSGSDHHALWADVVMNP